MLARNSCHDRIDPFARVLLVVDITIDSRMQRLGPERRQSGIELSARFAESLVARVAEGKNRVLEVLQRWRFTTMKQLVKSCGTIRWIAFAVCAHDHEKIARLLQMTLATIQHVDDHMGNAALRQCLADLHCQAFAVAAL